jgi:hypothetical protein
VAQTSISHELGADDRVKIACVQASKHPVVR